MKVVELQTPQQGVDVEYLAQQHYDEFGNEREFDVRAVTDACVRCVLDKHRGHVNCWIVYSDVGRPIGYLAGTIHRSFYSRRDYAVQQMWFVVRNYRGTRAALKLLRSFEEWAKRKGVERIYTQVEHDSDFIATERTLELMRRLGYNKTGYIAVKVVDNTEELNNDRSTHRTVGAKQAQV